MTARPWGDVIQTNKTAITIQGPLNKTREDGGSFVGFGKGVIIIRIEGKPFKMH